ncbi:hypothetical protein CYMTET_46737 [Cymbomonas tetramitiformis]|uniref:Stress-response A/B barrel domain-containing protein n=1 Tax=Cymbomonas tetramitiformis TaxID=36881 RepID=A0AAE0EXA4_9CHLO|nr:hypothetical protein CYMTET_46737 [Cymbomonas tetramitiformis]
MAIRHIVTFTFVEDATDEQKNAITTALKGLPELIPEIKAFTCGLDAGLSPGNAQYGLVADFENEADFRTYAKHPEHQKVIAENIKPILATRVAVQLSL